MERRRHHVVRERVAEPAPKRGGIEWRAAGVDGHQMLAAVGSLNSDDRALANSGYAQKCVFNLANLDSEAADLHLKIPAAEVLQLALGQPAAVVTAAVQPAARAGWVRQERFPRALWGVDIAASDADAGEDNLSRR